MQLLQWLLDSEPWKELMVPEATARLELTLTQLARVTAEKAAENDDVLRGRILVYQWLLSGLPGALEAWAKEKLAKESAGSEDSGPPAYGDPYSVPPDGPPAGA
jgi:hypothetical protein